MVRSRNTRSRAGQGLALLAVLALGCTSTYEPRRGPRLSVLLENGGPVLVKRGQRFPIGLGDGLVEAVADNPEATEHALEFRDRNTTGLLMAVGGLLLEIGSSVLLVQQVVATDNRRGETGPLLPVALGGLGVSLVLEVAGLVYVSSAPPHLWDAINRYNDDATAACEAVTGTDAK